MSHTRLHSSRMHTARLLTVSPSMHCAGGVSALGGVPGLGDVCSGGCLVQGGSALGGVSAPGVPGPGGIPGCTEADTPVNRMTDRCKNSTLPQTSFAGGNMLPCSQTILYTQYCLQTSTGSI